ncbi:MAG TPA: response regulator [Candidatus Acidoferrales bacterium]|nr:response regulator [Candidatus Acidoferrales bacterium]
MNPVVNILLVDDEPRNLEVLCSILGTPDLNLVRATNPEDALLALVQAEFACIILDVQMPSMSGIELARLIKTRKRNQYVPIIFLTAYFLEDKDILQGYGAGAVDYLTKPINPQILKSKVDVFVDLFRATHALAAANGALEIEIAQRKKAEEALRQTNVDLETRVQQRTAEVIQAEKRYRQIVSTLPTAIYTTDAQGRLTLFNDAAIALWGGRPELNTDSWRDLVNLLRPDGTRLPPDQCPMAITLKTGEGVRGEEILIERQDGTRRHVLPYSEPLFDARGKLVGAVNMLMDITERKQAEMELKKAHQEVLTASRAKDDFLATLSHELRTPLNPVLLIASDAVTNRELPPRVRADFDTIRKNVELEARLIDDLLDLTRIERGKIILEKQILNVHRVLRDTITQEGEELNRKEISLNLKLNAAQHAVFGDAVRLQQIFWNLVNNAIKFTDPGGQITIETSSNQSRIVIRITDTGIGLTPDEVGCVFKAFSQGAHAGNGNRNRFGGLGLGLAISQKLAELHAGHIVATSEGHGKGATFAVELPLAQIVDEEGDAGCRDAAPGAATPAPGKGIRILLVEDHEPTRNSLARLLLHRHYEVATAASIAEARCLANEKDFDLLISDIGLPDGNGNDLMTELRKNHPLKGIALTGYGMEHDVARSQDAGFLAHLTKPVGIQSLETVLNTVFHSV